MKLIAHIAEGVVVGLGTLIPDFRGEEWIFLRATRPNSEAGDGKVLVKPKPGSPRLQQEFYAGVFNLTVVESP